ncbi:patatin-like phospholipase family protein [Methylocystis sp. IM3]|uniref:patatin-like phospholipase family protein n=2 Tax=Methylocystis TaxID=133 RepID=UPI000FB74A4C|nr:MAG: patatin-like phospholipase family protein [Hyphomicrobiales bacterium]
MSAGKTAFVLAGGGSLGCVQVGMLRALLAAGVAPDFVVGSSVGALNASYFAAYPHAEGVEALATIWFGLRRRDVFPFSMTTALAVLKGRDYLVDPAPLRRLVEKTLPFRRLEEAPLPVHLVATDMQGIAVPLSQGDAVEAIMASAAVPGVFPPVEIDDVSLMDGAVAANTPLSLAAALGARRVFILPTGYACDLEGPPSGAVARALHAITLLIAWQLMRDIERLPEEIEVRMAPALCPLNVSPYDFSQAESLISRATLSTRRWIEQGGLTRPASPRQLAPHHHQHAGHPATHSM